MTCPKTFRYMQWYQRDDLSILLCDDNGPVDPVWVRFTLYLVMPSGVRRQIGVAQRTPVHGGVGEFYASGKAGDGGQPGDWVIVWEFRLESQSVNQTTEMEFQVLDAVAANDPLDETVRCRRYGWT
jgi:hypothetical protein